MDDDQRKSYALHLIQQAAKDVDYLGMFEQYPEWAGTPEDEINDLPDADGKAIDELIQGATITVTFADGTEMD